MGHAAARTFPAPAPVWFHNVRLVHAHGNSAFAEACVKCAPGHGTQLGDGDVARVPSASCPSAGVQNVVKTKIGGVGGARSALRRSINTHEVHAVRFPFVTQVMWATRAPQLHRGKVLVVIAIDGTRSHNRSFLHFSVGDVRSSLPYGSWVFVHGPEKKSVLQRLSAVAELNDEIKDVQQTTYIDSNGFECSVEFEIIADGKGHVALSACKGWTTAHPLAVVCWLCGRSHEVCVNQFGSGHGRIKDEWEHIGVVLSAVKPKQRPPEYGLHGAHRMVCCGCTGLYNALRDQHAFTEKRASEWVQFYLDPIRIQARTVTAQDVVGEDREGVHIEQTAAGEWIKAQGWECIADELQNSNLLQHDIVHNGVRVPWGEGFRQWGVLLHGKDR